MVVLWTAPASQRRITRQRHTPSLSKVEELRGTGSGSKRRFSSLILTSVSTRSFILLQSLTSHSGWRSRRSTCRGPAQSKVIRHHISLCPSHQSQAQSKRCSSHKIHSLGWPQRYCQGRRTGVSARESSQRQSHITERHVRLLLLESFTLILT